jgi:hypothetical protein
MAGLLLKNTIKMMWFARKLTTDSVMGTLSNCSTVEQADNSNGDVYCGETHGLPDDPTADPMVRDTDGDGLTDQQEYEVTHTDPDDSQIYAITGEHEENIEEEC